MVRFIHISDVHLGFEQYGQKERHKDFARAFNHAIEMGIRENVDLFIIAGDLFNKKNIKASTLLQADTILVKAKDAGIPVIVCEGNHDSLSYGDSWSWLAYLARKDLIVLLGLPFFGGSNSGKVAETLNEGSGSGEDTLNRGPGNVEQTSNVSGMMPWNETSKEGTYLEMLFNGEKVRIYGFGYLGAATKTRIGELSSSIIRDEAINIGILHAGVEGVIANMHGTIPENALRPFHETLDYLALGHIHKRFDIENRVFNCGSLENWSLDESGAKNPHGLYLVEMTKHDGICEVDAHFVNGEAWRRPFLVIPIDLTGSNEQQDVLDRVDREMRTMIPGTIHGRTDRLPESPRRSDPEPLMDRETLDEGKGIDRPELYMGTLDAFMKPKKHSTDAIRGVDDTIPERTEPEGKVGGSVEKKEGAESNEDAGTNDKERPVIIVRLKGEVGLKEKIDIEPVKERIIARIHPPALYLEIRDETTREGFIIEEDKSASSREELERQVIREILTQGEYGDHADSLHTLVYELKKATANRDTGDLNTFDSRIRAEARNILKDSDHQEDSDTESEE